MKDFNFMLIIDLVIAGLGIYLSYAAIIMKTRSALPPAFVASEELKRCKDPEGFATYMEQNRSFCRYLHPKRSLEFSVRP